MKMKLAQRLLIGYYKTKLKTLTMVSPRKAAEAAFRIFCTPHAAKPPKKSPPVFHKADPLSLRSGVNMLRGWRWKAEHPNGKKVLIVHGFRSYAWKFEKFIPLLRKEGFEVIAFDAPAHGHSEGKLINAYIYKQALLDIEAAYGPFYAIIGHSLGGLATALAAEEMTETHQRKLVLVAPATETGSAIRNFFSILPVEQKVEQAFEEMILELSGKPISYYSVSRVAREINTQILWVHDKHDTICPFADVQPLLSEDLPNTRFLVTEKLGHSRIYKEQWVVKEIIQFLIP